jgi:hypothetical protein
MRAKVQAVWTPEDFELTVDAPPVMMGMAPEGVTVAVPVKVGGAEDPRVEIILAKHERPGGDRSEFVAVNGVAMLIPRGEKCSIPFRYFEVLQNAVETIYIQNLDTGERMARKIPSFQYQITRFPDQRAVDAYLERTRDEGKVAVVRPIVQAEAA